MAQTDWTAALVFARATGLGPLVYWHLHASCPDAVPSDVLAYLRDRFQTVARRNLALVRELIAILDDLESRQVFAVPFKGPALAARLYGNLALRECLDLDLIVGTDNVPDVHDVLTGRGYRPQLALPARQRSAFLESQGELLYRNQVSGLGLWVRSVVVPGYACWSPGENLRCSNCSVGLGGRIVPCLEPEELVLRLCVYAARRMWERLVWAVDVAKLIVSPERTDWERLLERAHRSGAERVLHIGLTLAHEISGVPVPAAIEPGLRRDGAVRRLVLELHAHPSGEVERPRPLLGTALWHVRARERLRDRISSCWRLAVTPAIADWGCFKRRAPRVSLLYLVRPVRLLARCGRRIFGRPPRRDLGGFVRVTPEFAERMLALAGIRPGDVVYDLGCGDGRLAILAAKRYGVRAVGIDIDRRRISEARANARREAVEHLVTFIRRDAKTAPLDDATVVLLYLPWQGAMALRQVLHDRLRPGARIVSCESDLADWRPAASEIVTARDGTSNVIYLWRTVSAAAGAARAAAAGPGQA